jgi:hypothetical protein
MKITTPFHLRYLRTIVGAILLVSFASCTKWLDIQPKSEIDREVLFSTEYGFREALLGVYTRGARSDLYGKELTIGTPEVLAQNYRISSSDPYRYQKTQAFEFDDPDFLKRKDDIWQGLCKPNFVRNRL